ncbi:MAG: transketolase [Alphaproteobacteria bacterium]|nr:transketolase [Alphaproteobacteria bacterium]
MSTPHVTAQSAELSKVANRLRFEVTQMIARAHSCHVGSCLSVMDILVALYGGVMKHGADADHRDRMILSKGHAAAALYAVLAEYGRFPAADLENYLKDGSPFIAHTNTFGISGVEFSTGSLGHGLSVANGIALAAKTRGQSHRVFTVLSEGDCQEGSTWEAAMFAAHHRLSSMVAIIDHNKIQNFGRVDEVFGLAPLDAKWQAAGWAARNVDGHDMSALLRSLTAAPFEPGRPSVLIAHTVKGKGVSFMEDQLKWHYQTPSADEVAAARLELLS